jgi:hypothetical protein
MDGNSLVSRKRDRKCLFDAGYRLEGAEIGRYRPPIKAKLAARNLTGRPERRRYLLRQVHKLRRTHLLAKDAIRPDNPVEKMEE